MLDATGQVEEYEDLKVELKRQCSDIKQENVALMQDNTALASNNNYIRYSINSAFTVNYIQDDHGRPNNK